MQTVGTHRYVHAGKQKHTKNSKNTKNLTREHFVKMKICVTTNKFCFYNILGLFCHHVIAVFEHIRLDEIPKRYILRRYTNNVVIDPGFDHRDYKTSSAEGTSLEYKRTILYSEAMKIVTRGCSSEENFELALEAFREVNSRMDPEDCDMSNRNDRTLTEETPEQSESTPDTRPAQDTNPYADIKAPPVVRTKGSGKKPESANASAPTRPEPELDEHGKPKGTRLCSNCNKIDGHNSRTCKKRQLAKQLLETHLKVYGNSKLIDKVKKCIKNLLAK
jgi:hypothetical protein